MLHGIYVLVRVSWLGSAVPDLFCVQSPWAVVPATAQDSAVEVRRASSVDRALEGCGHRSLCAGFRSCLDFPEFLDGPRGPFMYFSSA